MSDLILQNSGIRRANGPRHSLHLDSPTKFLYDTMMMVSLVVSDQHCGDRGHVFSHGITKHTQSSLNIIYICICIEYMSTPPSSPDPWQFLIEPRFNVSR